MKKQREILETRDLILRAIRSFFWEEDFVEVEAPLLVRYPGQEPHLSPIPVSLHDERSTEYSTFLYTSPEYTMKKLLGAGFERIVTIQKCFRDHESFGGIHQPEFTMMEWYRREKGYTDIMNDIETLCQYIAQKTNLQTEYMTSWERVTMRELWRRHIGIDLDLYLEKETLLTLCREEGFTPSEDEAYEDLFYRLFLNLIEPHLGKDHPTIVYEYPATMAALARLTPGEKYAERFEVYMHGIEIANAFGELTDATEQKRRFEEEQKERAALGKEVYATDPELLEALTYIPAAAGIALGVDRLVQVFTSCQTIDDVLVLPLSKQFSTEDTLS